VNANRISLDPEKRVLFLTKDPELIRRQLAGELDLRMEDLAADDLMDDINTDTMTPAWVCFAYDPAEIARNAYAGLIVDGERVFGQDALRDGGFEVIVSGVRKGVGSSRETAVQCEKWSGIRIAIAASFAPIHARNNINQGVLMGDHEMLVRLQAGEEIDRDEFAKGYDPITQEIVRAGGLFPFLKKLDAGEVELPPVASGEPRPRTMAEKVLARHLVNPPAEGKALLEPGDSVFVNVDAGYTHEFTTAQVHHFLIEEFGDGYGVVNPDKFAVFEDHLIYADGVERMMPYSSQIQTLRDMQNEFRRHTGVRDYSANDGVSPGICHEVARQDFLEPGDLVQATDSHTCMGGGVNALAWGVGATEYAALVKSGQTLVKVPESIRFELTGELRDGVAAKDVMLHILLHYAKPQKTLDRVMEFGGPGLFEMSMGERATLANMATECSAKTGICEADDETIRWIAAERPGIDEVALRARTVAPDPGARYDGGVHEIDLSALEPMVATPGDAAAGVASDPTNGADVAEIGEVPIDIAYGGSCTAGKATDMDQYAAVLAEAVAAGRRVAEGVSLFIQFGSKKVQDYSRERGYLEVFEAAGATIIDPGCGACIGCGPGVSETEEQVTVSAINRNFKGRSGPGKMYLASPYTVAASAIEGRIVAWQPGRFAEVSAGV
jgi:3-isopropylmalate/(R)-2-methylmalate dehydratase large subunit